MSYNQRDCDEVDGETGGWPPETGWGTSKDADSYSYRVRIVWVQINLTRRIRMLSLKRKLLTTAQPSKMHNIITVQPPCNTRSSSLVNKRWRASAARRLNSNEVMQRWRTGGCQDFICRLQELVSTRSVVLNQRCERKMAVVWHWACERVLNLLETGYLRLV